MFLIFSCELVILNDLPRTILNNSYIRNKDAKTIANHTYHKVYNTCIKDDCYFYANQTQAILLNILNFLILVDFQNNFYIFALPFFQALKSLSFFFKLDLLISFKINRTGTNPIIFLFYCPWKTFYTSIVPLSSSNKMS